MSSPWQLQFRDLKSRSKYVFETKVMSDCSFLVGKENSQNVEGHKFILKIASPVFQKKISEAHPDTEITLSDVEPDIFQSILKYVYTDSIDIDANTVYDLAAAAKTYQLPGLLKACLDHISRANLTSKNVLETYNLALNMDESDVKKKCEEFIKTHTKEILADSSFEEACLDVVEAVFSLEKLDINSELELLNAADRYAKHVSKCEGADSTSIRNVLAKIRFLSLTPEEFAKGQSTTSVLSATDACAILAHIAYDKSGVPMPTGFSLRRDPRKKANVSAIKSMSEIRFEFSVPDIGNLIKKNEDAWSSTFTLRNLKWKMHTGKRIEDSENYLGLFANCNWESMSNTWSCNANVEFTLLRDDKGVPIKKNFTKKFNRSETNWGFIAFIKISDLLDPKNHYLKDGAITFEIHIKADEPQGL